MKLHRRHTGLLAFVLLSGLFLVSCDSAAVDDSNGTGGSGNGGNTADPDRLAGYLVMKDASERSGTLPSAPDLGLKISVRDTFYVVKDFPHGGRVVVRHNGLHDVSGFYVGVSNGSVYYDVPAEEGEAQDSTDVIYINVDVPGGDDVEYPLTIPIKILPHGPDGAPLDEFTKWVTIEDPEDAACPITVENRTPLPLQWEWEFTMIMNYTGEVFQVEAPGLRQISSYQTGGCCNADGSSTTVANDPSCFEKFSDGTPNPRWRSIDVEHYFAWAFDILWLFDDGTFKQWNYSQQTNYRPSMSDFCNNVAAYDHDTGNFAKTGVHDFTPGTNFLNITYDQTDPPVFGKSIRSGEVIYTCHSLILSFGSEHKVSLVYRKFVNDHDPIVFAEWD